MPPVVCTVVKKEPQTVISPYPLFTQVNRNRKEVLHIAGILRFSLRRPQQTLQLIAYK